MKLRKFFRGSWIARRSTTLLVVTVAGGGLMILAHAALARAMSQADYGSLSYALGTVEFVMSFALIGLPTVLLRESAAARADDAPARVFAGTRFVRWAVLWSSLAVGAGIAIFLLLWAGKGTPLDRSGMFAVIVYAVALSQLDCEQALMRGLRAPVAAAIPNQFLRPVLILAGAGIMYLAQRGSGGNGLMVLAAATLITLLATIVLANVRLSALHAASGERIVLPPAERWRWIRSGTVITAGTIARNLQHRASFVVLGLFVAPEEIALFAVSLQIARLIQLALSSVVNVASPVLAEAVRSGDHEALRAAYSESVRWVALVSIVCGAAIVLGGPLILSLYGPGYVAAYATLLVVVAARLVATMTGPTGAVMVMGGDEGRLSRILWIGGGTALALSFALVPYFGSQGAAWSMFSGVTLSNVLMLVFLNRKYGLRLRDALFGRTRGGA